MSEFRLTRVSIETTQYAKVTSPVLSHLKKKDMRQDLKSLDEKLLPDLSSFEVISIDQTKENVEGPFDLVRIQMKFSLRSLNDPNLTLVIFSDHLKEKDSTDH